MGAKAKEEVVVAREAREARAAEGSLSLEVAKVVQELVGREVVLEVAVAVLVDVKVDKEAVVKDNVARVLLSTTTKSASDFYSFFLGIYPGQCSRGCGGYTTHKQ